MEQLEYKALQAALQWHLDHGADEVLEDEAVHRTIASMDSSPVSILYNSNRGERGVSSRGRDAGFNSGGAPASQGGRDVVSGILQEARGPASSDSPPLGASDARAESVKLAQDAGSLEDLREVIAAFEGIAIKKTATNLVFCDGNPKAPIMLVGEAPGADEDRLGKPFVGLSGQLLDKILACIGLDRHEEDPAKSIYISNILNWRPPGNRTPSPGEIEASLPFIERHIQLAAPKILIFCGGVPAKALLGRTDGVSRMRKLWHGYQPQTEEFRAESEIIPAIATYHPAYLLRTPSQKKAVWADMLMVQKKRGELGILG